MPKLTKLNIMRQKIIANEIENKIVDNNLEHPNIELIAIIKKIINLLDDDDSGWSKVARPEQLEPPGNWQYWLILAGRGFGKTRTGAQTIWEWIRTKRYLRIALIGQTLCEAKSIMIEGQSGLLSVIPHHLQPKYLANSNKLIFKDGQEIHIFGADNYEKLRGPQFDAAWVDELAKFKYCELFWQQLLLCLRLGSNPRCIITTTPKPNQVIKALLNNPATFVTTGSTFQNKANLAPNFLKNITDQFGNTRFADQELYGHYLENSEDKLWQPHLFKYAQPEHDEWQQIIIGVDPALTANDESDETGIIIAGLNLDEKFYILGDYSLKAKPHIWAQTVINVYNLFRANKIVVEANAGGDLIPNLLLSLNAKLNVKSVRATKSKFIRAQPIVSLYEQQKIFHLKPFLKLEKQMLEYEISSRFSPDRLDALVWALSELCLANQYIAPKCWS